MSPLLAKRPPNALFQFSSDRFTQPFWDAAAAHLLTAPQCGICRAFRLPPTPFCPQCRSQEINWVTLSGLGTVYSYTVVSRAVIPGTDASLPYVPAVIELQGAGGSRLISNVVDSPLQCIAIDALVRVVWDDVNGLTVPRFELA